MRNIGLYALCKIIKHAKCNPSFQFTGVGWPIKAKLLCFKQNLLSYVSERDGKKANSDANTNFYHFAANCHHKESC